MKESQTYLGIIVRINPKILQGSQDLFKYLLGSDDGALIEESHNGLEDGDRGVREHHSGTVQLQRRDDTSQQRQHYSSVNLITGEGGGPSQLAKKRKLKTHLNVTEFPFFINSNQLHVSPSLTSLGSQISPEIVPLILEVGLSPLQPQSLIPPEHL